MLGSGWNRDLLPSTRIRSFEMRYVVRSYCRWTRETYRCVYSSGRPLNDFFCQKKTKLPTQTSKKMHHFCFQIGISALSPLKNHIDDYTLNSNLIYCFLKHQNLFLTLNKTNFKYNQSGSRIMKDLRLKKS